MNSYEHYREVFKITEYRDGAVYQTESQGYRWVSTNELKNPPEDTIFASPSTKVVEEMMDRGENTIRRIRDE